MLNNYFTNGLFAKAHKVMEISVETVGLSIHCATLDWYQFLEEFGIPQDAAEHVFAADGCNIKSLHKFYWCYVYIPLSHSTHRVGMQLMVTIADNDINAIVAYRVDIERRVMQNTPAAKPAAKPTAQPTT